METCYLFALKFSIFLMVVRFNRCDLGVYMSVAATVLISGMQGQGAVGNSNFACIDSKATMSRS